MNNPLLSIIFCSYYSNNRIRLAYEKLTALLQNEKIDFELIVMDDGSRDNSFEIATALERQNNNVRAYQLSRNFTSTYSIFGGLSVCCGSCAIPIPDDEQMPYENIVKMYRLWEQGSKSVFLNRESRRDFWFDKFFSGLFYKLMNSFSEIQYPPGGTDTFLIDRELIDILNQKIHPVNTSIITEIFRLGFEPACVSYHRPAGIQKKSRWTFRKKFKYGLDTFLSSSSFPIRFISMSGMIFSLLTLVMIIFYAYIQLFGNKTFWGYYPPGWTFLVLIISFFSGMILLSLGIIAEYIWRIYEEVKNRPGYIIKNKIKN